MSNEHDGLLKLVNMVSMQNYHAVEKLRNELLEAMVLSRLAARVEGNSLREISPVHSISDLDGVKRKLEELAPRNWKKYVECFDVGSDSYKTLPPGSCSTENHAQAKLFKGFLRPYLAGHVLDIGCGPQPVPHYLTGYPMDLIHGIDPISSVEDHPFDFFSGFGEFLPWSDQSFDVVVSGTTLDHYYLLDRGLQEVWRVLRSGGRYVAWITEFEDAPPYDPYSADVQPYDSEHMYHISRQWFLPMMREIGFKEVEILHFSLPFNYLFMSFEKP